MKIDRSILFAFIALMALLLPLIPAGANDNKSLNPHDQATISIELDGLLAVAFGRPERVSVGVLDAHLHTPTITITKIVGDKKSTVATLGATQLRGNIIRFDLEGRAASAIAPACRYLPPSMNDDHKSFAWTLDLERDIFQKELSLRADRLFAKLHFNTGGIWYADDKNITERAVSFVAADNSGNVLPFNRKFATPAMKLNLEKDQALVIRGSHETIRLINEPGTRYLITIHNLPPADAANIKHFSHYFDIIGEKVTEYKLIMAKPVAYSPRPLACASVIFSRSHID